MIKIRINDEIKNYNNIPKNKMNKIIKSINLYIFFILSIKSQIYCKCIYDGNILINNNSKSLIINIKIIKCYKKIFETFPKNYMLFVFSFLCFLFLICFFMTSINLSKDVTNYSKDFSNLKLNFSKSYLEEIEKENADKDNNQNDNNTNESYEVKLDFNKYKNIQKKINITEIQIFNRNLRNIYVGYNPYYRYYQYQKKNNKYKMDKIDYLNNYYKQYKKNMEYFENLENSIIMKRFEIPNFREFDINTNYINIDEKIKENKNRSIYAPKNIRDKHNKNELYKELRKNNNIDIFKKKDDHNNIIKNDEKIKNKVNEEFSSDKRYNTYNKNNKIFRRNKRHLNTNKLNNLKLNLKDNSNKPNPPRYPIGSERDLNKDEEELINNGQQQIKKNSKDVDNIKKLDFKFGSNEFFKYLNKIPENKRKKFFKESEINHLEYKHAYDIDDRMIFKIYSSMIKEQNNLVFSLSLCGNDYNLPVLKFSFLIIQIILYITISCLFFSDNIIYNFFVQKNKFDFIFMLKPMIFVFAACFVICILLKNLIKLNNTILEIKYGIQERKEGLNAIRLKLAFYFIIGFCICAFGWFLVCTFSSIFTNTVIQLLKTAGLAFAATFFFQIILCFFISSFRACSLNSSQKNCGCLYCFSNILTYT